MIGSKLILEMHQVTDQGLYMGFQTEALFQLRSPSPPVPDHQVVALEPPSQLAQRCGPGGRPRKDLFGERNIISNKVFFDSYRPAPVKHCETRCVSLHRCLDDFLCILYAMSLVLHVISYA